MILLVLDAITVLVDPEPKVRVGAPEGDAYEHVEPLVEHELRVLLDLLAIGALLDLAHPARIVRCTLEGLHLAIESLGLSVAPTLDALLAHLRNVGRVGLDKLVLHHLELILLRLKTDVDDEVVELVHRHLHRVLGAVLRDGARVREEDELQLLEEGLQDVVHLLVPRGPQVHVHELDARPAVEPLGEVRVRVGAQLAREPLVIIRLGADARRGEHHLIGREAIRGHQRSSEIISGQLRRLT